MAIHSKLFTRLTSPLALFLLAALLAAGVSMVAYLYLQKREAVMQEEIARKNSRRELRTVDVVVPRQDVPANTVMSGAIFVSRPVEDDLIYPDTLLAKDFASMEGLRLARPVLRGRPVRAADLVRPEVNDVAAILPKGLRAMTIDIDNLNSIAQTLKPNHRVDIFLLSKTPKSGNSGEDEKASEQATLFMQNMVVLATGRHFEDVISNPELNARMSAPGEVDAPGASESGFDSITLLVDPKEAAQLMLGQKLGTFRVVLRGANDRATLALRPTRAGDILPGLPRGRDLDIEFIVGGRGANMLGKLAVPPSEQLAAAVQTALAPSGGTAAALQASRDGPSNQPVPALRSR
jgi:pilus assembly protein CpaB